MVKPKINFAEKYKLLQKYAWSLSDITRYWNCSRIWARKIRDIVIAKNGTAKFSKHKVLVKDVLAQCNTSLEEQIKITNLLALKSTSANTNEISEEKL